MNSRVVIASGGQKQGLDRHKVPMSAVSLSYQQLCRAHSALCRISDQHCTAEDDQEAQHLSGIKISFCTMASPDLQSLFASCLRSETAP